MEDFVIQYSADISQVTTDLRKLERINSEVAKEFGNDFSKATRIVGESLDKISRTTVRQKVGNEFKNVSKVVQQTGTVVQLANGEFRNFAQTLTFLDGKLVGSRSALKNVTGQFAKTRLETEKSAKSTKTFGQNLAFLAQRAVTVIPIWFALRRAFTLVTDTLRDGFTSFVDFDRILAKSRQNLQGSATEIAQNFQRLRSEVQQLARDTGESVVDITSAFQRFATVGFDFETSLAGATAATKLAVTLFGNTEKTANALARAFKVLQDRTTGAAAPSEQLTQIVAQLRDLWVDNAFTIDEFSGALERFAPVANIANFSAQQTIAILAALQTAGIRGTRAGRLLSTAVLQLNKNFAEINGLLGTQVNPRLQTTFERFTFVLQALKELNEIDELAATKAVQELFGGVRGAQAVQALIAIDDVLEQNLKRTGDIEKFGEAVADVTEEINRQVDRFKELRTEISRNFVAGILGGDNFKDSLKDVNDSLDGTEDRVVALGRSVRTLLQILSVVGIPKIFDELTQEANDSIREFNANTINLIDEAIRGIRGKLSQAEIQDVLIRFTAAIDEGSLKISDKDRIFLEGNLRKQLEKDPIKVPITPEIDQPRAQLAPAQQQQIAELILKNELERQKALGATNSQLLKAELNLIQQLGLEREEIKLLEKQLDLERAISEERESQTRLQSETIKLFRIAQTAGVDVAQQIGRFLQGDIGFEAFARRGGEALRVFKEEFQDIFETQQAIQFFTGRRVAGAPTLRGGTRVPIEEEFLRGRVAPTFDPRVALQQARAEARFQRLQQPAAVTVPVTAPISVNVNVDSLNELAAKVEDELAKNITQVGTKVHNAVRDVIFTV